MIKSKCSSSVILIAVICMGLLSACGGRNSSNNSPTSAPQPVPAVSTSRPIPTARPDTSTPVEPTAVPSTAVPTAIPSTAAPTTVPTTTAPAKSDQSGAALQQLLQQLNDANLAGDSLSDVPEIK